MRQNITITLSFYWALSYLPAIKLAYNVSYRLLLTVLSKLQKNKHYCGFPRLSLKYVDLSPNYINYRSSPKDRKTQHNNSDAARKIIRSGTLIHLKPQKPEIGTKSTGSTCKSS